MKKIAVVLFILAALGGIAAYVPGLNAHANAQASDHKKSLYHCPMHPEYVSEQPGSCPICGMDLVPIEEAEEGPVHDHDSKESASSSPSGAGESSGLKASRQVEGYAAVQLAKEQQDVMGIRTARVKREKLEKEILTVGRVTYNEAEVHHIHTKFEGYIEDIFANYIGQKVLEGQPLFTIYSPEVLATQNEYLIALRAGGSKIAGVDLVESARRRLLLWGIDKREMEKIERTGKAQEAVAMYSPVTGYVIAKTAYHGMKITPADVLYDIADLSNVWVLADVYENDLPFVRVGEPAIVTASYNPGRSWDARLSYIYPSLDEKTRTVKVRLELSNPQGELKPEMFTNVLIKRSIGEGLVVPESAVLTTGERKIVFVKKEGGVFEPREITAGVQTRDFYEVKEGVVDGEQVVMNANFLLDSESKLKASIQSMRAEHEH